MAVLALCYVRVMRKREFHILIEFNNMIYYVTNVKNLILSFKFLKFIICTNLCVIPRNLRNCYLYKENMRDTKKFENYSAIQSMILLKERNIINCIVSVIYLLDFSLNQNIILVAVMHHSVFLFHEFFHKYISLFLISPENLFIFF
jgi:hypothetical protein